ncbi:MAG: bile acid:sodium symporter [Verrucomicrobiota bacterium]
MVRLLLPVGIIFSLVLACLVPEPGAWLDGQTASPVRVDHLLIFTIFLLTGWSLRGLSGSILSEIPRPFMICLLAHLVMWPLAVFGLSLVSFIPSDWHSGLIILAAVPTTLSSAVVISRQSGGNDPLAIILTFVLSLASVLTSPLILRICLPAQEFQFPTLQLTFLLAMVVALPLSIGMALRRIAKPSWTKQIPSFCILLLVWMTASTHQESLLQLGWKTQFILAALAICLHITALLIFTGISKLFLRNKRDQITTILVSSQKTLPLAVALLASIPLSTNSAAIAISLFVLYHLFQILIDSLWAPTLCPEDRFHLI